MTIKLYGAVRCHKTQHYIQWFKNKGVDILFYDVEENDRYAEELRLLYTNNKLNFPTIMLGSKKLRNPSEAELNKFYNLHQNKIN